MLDFGVHEKGFYMNRVMSLLRKSEMSSVSPPRWKRLSLAAHSGRAGGGTKRRITFQTMVEHVPLVAGIHFPTQPCLLYSRLSHDHWFINGCFHSCKSSSSTDFKGSSRFTQSLLFSFSFRKTPRGYFKKLYIEAHITKAWKSTPFGRSLHVCIGHYRELPHLPRPSPGGRQKDCSKDEEYLRL